MRLRPRLALRPQEAAGASRSSVRWLSRVGIWFMQARPHVRTFLTPPPGRCAVRSQTVHSDSAAYLRTGTLLAYRPENALLIASRRLPEFAGAGSSACMSHGSGSSFVRSHCQKPAGGILCLRQNNSLSSPYSTCHPTLRSWWERLTRGNRRTAPSKRACASPD
jgi:hypothetical protein